jgi:hypothetical protein
MKIALITTTINVPTVLKLYRKLAPDVRFFVAGDVLPNSQLHSHIVDLCDELGDCEYYDDSRQRALNYKCSELLGWKNDSRRNIALLEAVKWGAETIISVDDDMIPSSGSVSRWNLTNWTFSGLQLSESQHWLDIGWFTQPPAPQRGVPVQGGIPSTASSFVVDAKIGAAQGIILGVPDTDAITAIDHGPFILGATDILRNGFVVHPQAYSVFNSQFTAFQRELAPAFAQFYTHQGRNTDIFASMLMRRVMADRQLYTYFGPPFGFHARKARPLLNDLKAEMYGMEHIADFADYLHRAPLQQHSVIDDCCDLMLGCSFFSEELKKTAMAFYEDMESVL